MNRVIKKSMFCIMLITTGMGLGFEEHKQVVSSQLMSGGSASKSDLAITIQEPAHGDFQVPLIVIPLEQTAPQLAKVIAALGDPVIKQKATQFFQEQKSDALKDFNKAAKKALKPSAHDADPERAFIQKMRDCVQQGFQQEHETTRAALEQEHQENLAEIGRNARRDRRAIVGGTAITTCIFGVAYGFVFLVAATGKCHN